MLFIVYKEHKWLCLIEISSYFHSCLLLLLYIVHSLSVLSLARSVQLILEIVADN